jgi:hypothetical protein
MLFNNTSELISKNGVKYNRAMENVFRLLNGTTWAASEVELFVVRNKLAQATIIGFMVVLIMAWYSYTSRMISLRVKRSSAFCT